MVHSWNPPPLIKGGTALKRGGGVDAEVCVGVGGGGGSLFHYFKVQLHLLCVCVGGGGGGGGGGVKYSLLHFGFSVF